MTYLPGARMRLLLTSTGVTNTSIHQALVDLPGKPIGDCRKWAAEIDGPAYAVDDETAIRVVDGSVDVVFEGRRKVFAP